MKLSDGLSVLYITATGYFCAYCFQLGIFYHYNIPTELINITIQSMSSFCFFMISVSSIFIGPILDNEITIEIKKFSPITKLLLAYLTGSIVVSLGLYLFSHHLSILQIVLGYAAFLPVTCRDFIFPMIFRDGLSLKDSIIREYHRIRNKPRLTFLSDEQKFYFILANRCVILSILSLFLGGLYTVIQKHDTLCNTTQVLATSGDNVIIQDNKGFKLIPNSQCVFSKKIN